MIVPVILLMGLIGADAYEETFEEANTAYYKGDYEDAIQRYEQLAHSSVSEPAVFHNLGNAYFRSGNLGYAIVNFERALALDPGLTSTRENLQRAVEETSHGLGRPRGASWRESLLFWDHALSYGVVRIAAFFCWAVFWILGGLWFRRRMPYLRPAAAICLVLAALFGLSAWKKGHPLPIAVAVEAEVPVRYGMSEREKQRYILAEGDRVIVEERHADWVRIATVTEERGWARASSFLYVLPPYGGADHLGEPRAK